MASDQSSSFTTWKINRTTFAVREDDALKEHPLIYVKVHQKAPILVLSDTGTDEASESHHNGTLSRHIDSETPLRCECHQRSRLEQTPLQTHTAAGILRSFRLPFCP